MTPSDQHAEGGRTEARIDVERTLHTLDERDAAELAATWEVAGRAADSMPDREAVASALDRFSKAVESDLTSATQTPAPISTGAVDRAPDRAVGESFLRRKKAALAAAAVAGACIFAVILWPRTATLTVPAGDTAETTLADGSHVILNASSTLTYGKGLFADMRRVYLDGEAYFDVAEGERTFRVETFNATVSVLGTSFNVRAVRDGRRPSTSVVLESGIVQLEAGEAVVLRPGEMSDVDRDGVPRAPKRAPLEAFTAWRSGGFAMIDKPLYAVMEELERRFGVEISLQEADPGRDTISVHLPRAASAESVLADVCAAVGCRYDPRPGGFVVQTSAPRTP